MRIISKDNIDFVLPTGFAAELTKYNVLLSTAGEQTQPITLPPDPVNMKLIGYSNRMDAYYKPLTDLEVLVSDGLFHRWCNMGIHSANDEDGISCTLYFGKAEFSSKCGDAKLASLPWPVIKHADWSNDNYHVQYLIDLLKNQYINNLTTSAFDVFPVPTSKKVTWYHDTYTDTTYDGLFIFNNFDRGFFSSLYFDASHNITLNVFQGEFVQRIKESGITNPISLSIGYGMTPFLRLSYVLEFVFAQFGYTVDTSELEEVLTQYKSIVLLNNVADAICSGILRYSQLLPDMTIKNFILELEKLFSGKFFIDEIRKVSKFYRYQKNIKGSPDLDITNYLASKPKPEDSEFIDVYVVDITDTSTTATVPDGSEKIEFASVPVLTFTEIISIFKNTGTTLFIPFNLLITTPSITDIVHKNSQLIIGGVASTDTDKSLTSLLLAETMGSLNSNTITQNSITYTVFFRQCNRLFYGDLKPQEVVQSYYAGYRDLKKYSNIPISAKMNIPTLVLENIDIQKPKLLQGQPVMIESIKQVLGSDSSQDVKFRTLRLFIDR